MHENDIVKYLDNGRLHLIIMPTEKCNFRCTYCYEDFTNGKMSLAVANGIKSLITDRSSDLHTLEVGWFGGEPLLNLKLVEEISGFSKKVMEAKNGRFISSMSTNGYLLDVKTAASLSANGVTTFQISIDGDHLVHDRSRVLASGSGSFDKIWGNLIKIRDSNIDVLISLRIHVTKENIKSMENIASQINREFSSDPRFKIYVKPVENLGGNSIKPEQLIDKFKTDDVKAMIESLFSESLILKESRSKPSVCYASAGNSLVIRSTGEISKCTVLLSDKDNMLGRITSDGRLEIDNSLYGKWASGLFNKDSASCPVQHVKALTKT
ncbi:radical SAM protein [Vibrio fluvialis]|uniref:radical SAM protein n=1 Tax=Vibrio fluvialis TaxID=676 RepID=UPI00189E7E91|nr:radical SAM protein [Vibrio fluvialis]